MSAVAAALAGQVPLRAQRSGAPANDERKSRLTPSERETLALVARGLSGKEVARARGVKLSTVREQTKSARAKLAVASTVQAVVAARELGLIE